MFKARQRAGLSEETETEECRPRCLALNKKVVDFAKGAALAYVGVCVGLKVLKFVGKVIRRGKAPAPGPSKAPAQVSQATSSEDTWNVLDAPAPSIPDGYKPIASSTLPCNVQDFYRLLLSGSSSFWPQTHIALAKQWDMVATGWQRVGMADAASAGPNASTDQSLLGSQSVFEWVLGSPGSGGFSRLLTFVQPKKPPSTVDTRCVQRQQFCVYRSNVLVLATAMNMLDIPYRECFTVNTFWLVVPGAQPGECTVTVHLKVHFIRRPLVAGIISATTFRDTTAFYQAFLEKAAEAVQAAASSSSAAGGSSGQAMDRAVPFSALAADTHWPAAGQQQQALRETMPAWKQMRAVFVFMLLFMGMVHQLYLHSELQSIKAHTGVPDAEGGGGGWLVGALSGAVGDTLAQLTVAAQALYVRATAPSATRPS